MTHTLTIPKLATLLCFALALPHFASAHLGPPYPILVDQSVPGYSVTILANPDIGQAIFIVALEPVKSERQGAVSGVDIWIQPASGRIPKAVYHAREESTRGNLQFVANPDVDAEEMLKVEVDIHMGDGSSRSFATQVKSTPPGVGRWGVLFFFFPFVLFGGLFGMALVRRSRGRRARPANSPSTLDAGTASVAGVKRQ